MSDLAQPSDGPRLAATGSSPAAPQLMNRKVKGQMFSKELRFAGHVKRFLISGMGRDGWEVRQEQDERVVKQVRYTDWHRVERALGMFNLEIGELQDQGWVVA
jgi:hypothetical protein